MTFTDNNLSATATYTYEVSTVNWSDVSGAKSPTLTLRNGVVSIAVPNRQNVPMMENAQVSLMYSGSRAALAGPVAVYDIRGRRLASVDVASGAKTDVKAILGNRTNSLVIVKFQTK
jgi:hypothetical protein